MRSLRRISATMRRSAPVFIVGEARSGTSILYRTLQKHPSFECRVPSLVETELFAHLPRAFQFSASYPRPWIRFLLDDARIWREFRVSVRLPRLASALLAPVSYLLGKRRWALWRLSLGHLLLRSFAWHAIRARGCRRLVEKTPTHTRYLRQLTTAFPHCRLLYVHRHPVDVYSSYRRRTRVDPNAGWADLSIEEFARHWEASTQRVLRWLDNGHDNLLAVRYEDFCTDPAATMRNVCAFLDEPFDPGVVTESRPDPTRWPVDPHLWGEIVERTKYWRDHIEPADAECVQRRLASTMRRLGYQPYA